MEEKEIVNNEANEQNIPLHTDENAAGSTLLNEPVTEGNELEKIQTELIEQKDKFLRLMADFDNFRRRKSQEIVELTEVNGKRLITLLLDVLDDCDRAEKQLQTAGDIEKQKQGVLLVFNKLRNVLQNQGLKPMESLHTDFDVDKHEAIAEIPASDENLKGKVMDEVQKGYYLNDKIIRFAKVAVGK